MLEIEILCALSNSKEEAFAALKNTEFKGSKHTIDTYLYDPNREDLKADENGRLIRSFRVRETEKNSKITYKLDHFSDKGEWLYSDEHETGVESGKVAKEILNQLGLKELVVVDVTKHVFETEQYEIVFEEVKDAGNFIEVEFKGLVEGDPLVIKQQLREFLKTLGLNPGEELNMGKPEYLLRLKAK
jgi:predicted adenylyl cyclase CyaB